MRMRWSVSLLTLTFVALCAREEADPQLRTGLPGRARLSRPAEAPSSFAPSAVFSSSHGLSTLSSSSSPHLPSPTPSGSLLPSLTVKAIDRQRQNLVAYEYLCHCRETQEWLDGCVGERVRASDLWIGADVEVGGEQEGKGMKEWEQGLRNGYALAHLARALGSPACGGPIYNVSLICLRRGEGGGG
jgi:Ras GTPase-activating-like protein IQGAP2/3